MSKRQIPRLMIAGMSSGSGKTTVTCALLTELMRRSMRVASFKCGPDYIDPMFHSRVIGTQSRNLDLFFAGEELVRTGLAQHSAGCDISVIEGVMGFYDGLAGKSTQASSYALAKATQTPVILVVDCKGMSVSVAAQVKGFAVFRNANIAGVILNRAPAGLYVDLKDIVERETGIAVLGYLPERRESMLESRHLGLVTAAEVENLHAKLNVLANQLRNTVDVDAMLKLAQSAPPLTYSLPEYKQETQQLSIAVAQDDAFCFYYQDTLDLLERLGALLLPFSPLRDVALPQGAAGMLLGGGYPELHARELSQNKAMLHAIRNAVTSGMPCIAECGGFMYLHRNMQDEAGESWPMAGVINNDCYKTEKLTRFGYVELTAHQNNLLHQAGERVRGHEFHYWDSENPGDSYTAQKPLRKSNWQCVHATDTMYAGYPHLYLAADEPALRRFLCKCAAYVGDNA